jgi:hypothetical protein
LFCREKSGACMQCCYGKCWKSFHVTCALEADATMNSNDNKKGSLFDGYCPSHDPVSFDLFWILPMLNLFIVEANTRKGVGKGKVCTGND